MLRMWTVSPKLGAGSFYNVTFKQPTMPMENNYFSHKGNPALSNFACDVSGAFSAVFKCYATFQIS